MSGLGRAIMQKVIELNFEETKTVVGGLTAAPRPVMQRSPLAEIIGIIIRDVENAFGGRKQITAAQK